MSYPTHRRHGSVLVFDGPSSNLQATQALFSEADRLGIGPENIICTGDIVAYCGSPRETVDLIREKGVTVIQGNCEQSIGNDSDECSCGYDPNSICDLLSRQWHDYARTHLDDATKAWLRRLPRQLVLEIGGRRLAVVHGHFGASAPNLTFYPSTPRNRNASEIDAFGADGIIVGHTALPFVQLVGTRLWLNTGNIGFPANDGTPRGWYSLIHQREEGLEIEIRALHYEYKTAAHVMRANGLDNAYADALETGVWPGMDGVPEPDRAGRGRPLHERRLMWPGRVSAGPDPVAGERVTTSVEP